MLSAAVHTFVACATPFKRILVTGANKGIGLQICRRILRDHPDCSVLLGSRSLKRGQDAVSTLIQEDSSNNGRVEVLELDVTNDDSVESAVDRLRGKEKLYGIVNNAGIGFGRGIPETLNTNLYGVRRVCEKFLPLLEEKGRVVNIASASAPNFVSRLRGSEKDLFTSADTTWSQLQEVVEHYANQGSSSDAYGLSKASLNVYTRQLAKQYPTLRINSCSPGYVLTDLTAGMGATNTPEASNCHVAPLFLLFGEPEGNGRYYGSDAVRSPIDRYRSPGDPPYIADD